MCESKIDFSFTSSLKTLPVDASVAGGPLTGEPRAISKVILDLNSTLSVSVNGVSLGVLQVTDDLSQPKTPVTGKRDFNLLGYGKDPQVSVTQPAPLTLQVNSIIAEVIV